MTSLNVWAPSIASPLRRVGGILLLALLLPAIDTLAGVLVAPTVVFLSDKNRTGRLTIQNPGDKPQEVSIHFSFGIPTSDSAGNIQVALQDSLVDDPNSCMGWVRAFPRRLTLAPGSSQVVRFVATPPDTLATGEYWARVVVKSQDAETNTPQALKEGEISTKLNMVMQTAIMMKFRNGELYSELELTSVEATDKGDNVDILVDMASKGTASYVGLLFCRLLDANNKEMGVSRIHLAVYRQLRRQVTLPVPPEGFTKPYHVEVQITSRGRTDIAAEDMVFGNDLSYSVTLE
jgi:P pilus assembly chaperone PapD